ncbi:MAG TPA: GIY-YIG nuclease family protein [Verrucomicrobiae bacterium]|nr:GIY-YIG nuclease family protein [Verrucomicrobiae bacterium]
MAVYHVYILASASGVLYTGVTNFLERRVAQHKAKLCPGFTAAYDVTRLVYFEPFTNVRAAISREKQLKNWRREKKLAIIRAFNPTFRDLSADFPGATNSKRASTKPTRKDITPCLDPSTPARKKPPVLRSG